MAREHIEIAIECLHVRTQVRHGLCPINQDACAIAMRIWTIWRTGVIVPKAFETCVTDTRRVLGPSSFSNSSSRICPSSSTGATRRRAPVSAANICQGTIFAWCSIQLMTISSSLPIWRRPQLLRHQIDGLRRAADKDDLFHRRGIEKARYLFACILIRHRSHGPRARCAAR